MKVKELIQVLGGYPPETIVSVDGYESGVTDYIDIQIKRVLLNQNDDWYYGEHEETQQTDSLEPVDNRLVLSRGERAKSVMS